MIEFTWHAIYEITKTLPKRKQTTLALYCTQLVNPKTKLFQECIDLIQQWLDNPTSITIDQLIPVADDAWAAANTNNSYYTLYYATYAADSAKSYKSQILPYLEALTKKLPKTPYTDPEEIIIYLQDQELYPILDGHRLNLWDKDYEYQVTGYPQQIANTLGVRNLLNA